MVKRILALSLLMVGLVACGGQEDPAGELDTDADICNPLQNAQCDCYILDGFKYLHNYTYLKCNTIDNRWYKLTQRIKI